MSKLILRATAVLSDCRRGLGLAAVLVAGLPVALGLTSYASAHNSGHRATRHSKRATSKTKSAPRLHCGPIGNVKAFGYVFSRAGIKLLESIECGPSTDMPGRPPPEYFNAMEGQPNAGSPPGTYCFRAAHGVRPEHGGDIVVVSVAEQPVHQTAEYVAAWMPGAPNCLVGEFEIQTWEVTVGLSGFIQTPSGNVSFTFVIP